MILSALVLTTSDASSAASTQVQISMGTGQANHLSMSDVVLAYQLPMPSVVINSLPSRTPDQVLADVVSHQVDFAVTSRGLNASQAAAYSTLTMFPMMASAIVPVLRLDSIGTSVKLALTMPTLAQIFLGVVTWWNDSRIAVSNPLITLPNTTITVVLQPTPSCVTLGFTQALSEAWPAFNTTIGVTETTAGWTSLPYAASRSGLSMGLVPSVVLAVDGSIGFAAQANAMSAGVTMADLYNAVGARVTASAATVNAAATDLGTNVPPRTTLAVDLTNSDGGHAWPIAIMSYALLDTQYTPAAGCGNRHALVQFLLWYYGAGSTVVSTLLGSRGLVPVPPIVLTQMSLVSRAGSTIYCNGSVIPPDSQPVVRINSHGSQAVVIGAQLTSAYAAISNITFQAFTQTDLTVMQQVMDSTVDLGFLVRETTNSSSTAVVLHTCCKPGFCCSFFIVPSRPLCLLRY